MTLDRRVVLGLAAGMVGGWALPALAQPSTKDNSKTSTTTVTVLGDLHPPTMARIAISPNGQKIAYVAGRATAQQLLIIDLSDMSQKVYPLGSVFLTEMMWGSDGEVLVRLRYFRPYKKNATTTNLVQTRYVWIAMDLLNSRRPLPIHAVLTEMSRVEKPSGFGLVYEKRVSVAKYVPDIETDLAGRSPGEQLQIMQQLMETGGGEIDESDDQEDGAPDAQIDDVDTTWSRRYDEFYWLDLGSEKEKKLVSLDQQANDYAISADGKIIGFSTFIKDKHKGEISFLGAPDERHPSVIKVLDQPATSTKDLKVEGVGSVNDSLLVSADNRARFFELGVDGTQKALEFKGKPIFDAWTHLHVGFLPEGEDQEPMYFNPQWVRIWTAIKSMAPTDAVVRVESHAKDQRKLVISLKSANSDQTLYHFIDLTNGRTEFLTRSAIPLHVDSPPAG